jgi:hypothetical protein
MASIAECYQVIFRIITGLATEFLVVNFEVRHGPTSLASPAVSVQNLVAELLV